MRVVLAPVGSRGDVQPMLALAAGLVARGHTPVFSVTQDFAPTVAARGYEYTAVDLDAQAVATGMGNEVRNPIKFLTKIRDLVQQVAQGAQAAKDAQVVVGGGAQVLASSLCQAQGIPYIFAAYAPTMVQSQAHAPMGFPWQGLPAWLNQLLWKVNGAVANLILRKTLNAFRSTLGIPPLQDVWSGMMGGPLLGAFDAALVHDAPEFAKKVCTTGFWFLEDKTPLEPELEAFLAAGPPPVYIGFGSMPNKEEVDQEVLEGVRQAGVRAVVASGWSNLGSGTQLPQGCLSIKSANHRLLFPRVAAVVHHGGAGTTSAAARAGVPQFVVPHLLDQYYWGHRVATLGLGPKPIPVGKLRAGALGAVILQLCRQDAHRSAAQALAAKMISQGGVMAAVDEIERVVQVYHSKKGVTPPM